MSSELSATKPLPVAAMPPPRQRSADRYCCCCPMENRLVLLPLTACLSFPATFFITYGIAVGDDHVRPDFPFISDTGTLPPESCVFGQLLNASSVLVALTVYVKYRQLLATQSGLETMLSFRRVNAAALFFGLVAAFGVSLVANFQWTNVLSVHMVGAFFAFILGIVYGWLQCWLSLRMPPPMNSKPLLALRVTAMALATVFLLLMAVGVQTTSQKISFTNPSYVPDAMALLTTTSEWVMAFGLAAMFATFAIDFRYIDVGSPLVTWRRRDGWQEREGSAPC